LKSTPSSVKDKQSPPCGGFRICMKGGPYIALVSTAASLV
jgi:hypothetical protein